VKCGDDRVHTGATGVLMGYVTQYSESCPFGTPTVQIKAAKLIPATKLWKPLDVTKIELYTIT
jgi:hypothetical protein